MSRLRLAALLLGWLMAPLAGSARELWERDWIEVRTEHFVIASALSGERSSALAVDLENFRAGVRFGTNIGVFEERIPTKVYVLPGPVRELGFDGKIAGYFSPGMRANYAVVIPAGEASDEVLKHEYVHFLVHNRDAQLYSTWFDEGFAEVLSTLRVQDGVLEYGRPMQWRVESLSYGPWMPFPKLIAVRETAKLGRTQGAMFYAQSWFLMHYLMIGREGADFAAQSGEFIRGSEAGEPPARAFETAFGIPPSQLQKALARYGRKLRYFRAKLIQPLPPVSPGVRPLGLDEIAAELGLLAFAHGNAKAAQEYYDAALAANPDNAPALVGAADLHRDAKRWDRAVPLYERAIALEPENANHELDYGEYFLTRADLEDTGEQRSAFLIEARRHFARSYQLDPDNPETLDQNGLTYLFEGEDTAKGVGSLELAHELLPSQGDIQLHLATAYVRAGQPEKARARLQRLLAWSHSEAADEIEKLLASLEPSLQADAEPAHDPLEAD